MSQAGAGAGIGAAQWLRRLAQPKAVAVNIATAVKMSSLFIVRISLAKRRSVARLRVKQLYTTVQEVQIHQVAFFHKCISVLPRTTWFIGYT